MRVVDIGGRLVGPGQPCFVIAEAGSNHNGDLGQAKRLIAIAAEAGADAVKFQTFRASKLYPRSAGTSDYLKLDQSIYDIVAAMEMPYEWIPILAGEATKHGLLFLSTPFDERSADELEPYVPAYKIASYEMTHIPLVRYIARKGKPLIMSTGTAELAEVRETVNAIRETRNESLILLQCTASYPAPLDALNLHAIETMRGEFNVPVGLSDHSRDPIVGPVAAVALGASVIEKHFTFSNELPGPDHRFAVEPAELRDMVKRIRECEAALGSGEKTAASVEHELRDYARRTIFTSREIAAGETFSTENLAVLRAGKAGHGLPPAAFDTLLGKRARRALPAEAAVKAEDVE
jgi:N-acetylneuraminate synthase